MKTQKQRKNNTKKAIIAVLLSFLMVVVISMVLTILLCSCNLQGAVTQTGGAKSSKSDDYFSNDDYSTKTIIHINDRDADEKSSTSVDIETSKDITTLESIVNDTIETPDYSTMSLVGTNQKVFPIFVDSKQPQTLDIMIEDFHFIGQYQLSKYIWDETRQMNSYIMPPTAGVLVDNNGKVLSFVIDKRDSGETRYSTEELVEIAKNTLRQYANNVDNYSVEIETEDDGLKICFRKLVEGYKTSEYAFIYINNDGSVRSMNSSMLNEIDANMELPFDMSEIERQTIAFLDEEFEFLKEERNPDTEMEYERQAWEKAHPKYEYNYTIIQLNPKNIYVNCMVTIYLADENDIALFPIYSANLIFDRC